LALTAREGRILKANFQKKISRGDNPSLCGRGLSHAAPTPEQPLTICKHSSAGTQTNMPVLEVMVPHLYPRKNKLVAPPLPSKTPTAMQLGYESCLKDKRSWITRHVMAEGINY